MERITAEPRNEFYVWCKSRRFTTYKKHTSAAAAEAEAIRLGRLNPGLKYHVVQGVSAITVQPEEASA